MLPFPSPQYLFGSSLSGQFEASPTPQKPNPSSPFFPFSPPTFDSFHELLFATQLQPMSDINDKVAPPSMDPPSNKEGATEPTPPAKCSRGKATPGRKRVMRKDRHSKIFTAQGPRDRRMRLSLEVARKFFDLQDLLGFDKPSKTLQWLLTKSKSAIKDISGASRPKAQAPCSSINSLKSESSTSDCEDASTVSNYKGKSLETIIPNEANISKAKSVSGHPPRKAATHPALSRESRAKARARARERTREKKKLQSGLLESDERPNRLISSSIPYDSNGEVSISQDPKSSLELAAEVVLCSSLPNQFKGSLMDRVLEGIPGPAGPIPMFDYNICDNSTVNIIQEQWDMHFPGSIEERVSLADVQLPTKPWEAFNYSIL